MHGNTQRGRAFRGRQRDAVQQQCQRHCSREPDRSGGSDDRRLYSHRGLSFDVTDGNSYGEFGRRSQDLRPHDFINADRDQPEFLPDRALPRR